MTNPINQDLIAQWLYNNGRDLDITRFNYLIDDGDALNVLIALTIYQNDDGGFAKGIIPELMTPKSNVPSTLAVLRHIYEIGFDYQTEEIMLDDIVAPALAFLFKEDHWFKGWLKKNEPHHNEQLCSANYRYVDEEQAIGSWAPTLEALAFGALFTKKALDRSSFVEKMNDVIGAMENKITLEVDEISALYEALDILKRLNSDSRRGIMLYNKHVHDYLKKQGNLFLVAPSGQFLDDKNASYVPSAFRKLVNSRLPVGVWEVHEEWCNDEHFTVAFINATSFLAMHNYYIYKQYK